jgi:8-oxo-dGTP diphosphatase
MNDSTKANLPERHVVSCILERGGLILVLKRSGLVGSFRGRWAGVSGYVESAPDEQALTEIREETGLGSDDVSLLKRGDVVEAEGDGTRWFIHPFLFRVVEDAKIMTDWEHTEHCWITPGELCDYDTVPGLERVIKSVLDY